MIICIPDKPLEGCDSNISSLDSDKSLGASGAMVPPSLLLLLSSGLLCVVSTACWLVLPALSSSASNLLLATT